ncbi:hypothetical protein [Egicoccus sp. AB-alg2]
MRRTTGVALTAAAALAVAGCETTSEEPGPELGELDDSAIEPTDPPEDP